MAAVPFSFTTSASQPIRNLQHAFPSRFPHNPFLRCLAVGMSASHNKQLTFQFRAQASDHSISVVSNALSFSGGAIAKLVAIVGDSATSALGRATWEEVMRHTAQRLKWVDDGYELLVINTRALVDESLNWASRNDILAADLWVIVGVNDSLSVEWILRNSKNVSSYVSFQSSPQLKSKLNGRFLVATDSLTRVQAALPGNDTKDLLNVLKLIEEAWARKNSDDIRFVLLILIDKCITPVESLNNLRASDFNSLKCMIKNCGPQILACLSNPSCRKALSCLTKCAPTDQVCSYQCIVSYESPELEAFSLCVLQKHGCLGLKSSIPILPDVQPMKMFRDSPLTHDIAEDIFIGWLGKLDWSWRVAAGQNPAYDQFPCQFQIFYRGKGKGSMWYDPVFQVKKFDGNYVWRRRHYRVRKADVPGTFFLSVLDNGVVSKEFWRIVDAADDLSWGLFFYSGAAAAAGQCYTGAVLVTPDGQWPEHFQHERLNMAFEKCGIKEWEMYKVNNVSCERPPLGIPENADLPLTAV